MADETCAELAEHLNTALEWLDNLQDQLGTVVLLNSMPNNHRGRDAWRETLERAGLAPSHPATQ